MSALGIKGLESAHLEPQTESGEQGVPQSKTKVQLPKQKGRDAGQTGTTATRDGLLRELSHRQNLSQQLSLESEGRE